MYKKPILTGLLLVSFAVSGCAPATVGYTPSPEKNKSTLSEASSQESRSVIPSYQALVQKAGVKPGEVRSFIDSSLQQTTPADVSTMILGLEEVQRRELPALEQAFSADPIQEKLQAVMRPGSDLSALPVNANADLKDLLRQAQEGGYKIQTAEGMYFPVIDYAQYKRYQSAVTADIAAYIDIMSTESDHPPAKDAAIVIGWDELLRRATAQEKFINQYGNSFRLDAVKQLYSRYVTFAFYGANNTPLFSYEDKTLNIRAKRDYQVAATSAGNSRLLKAVGDYLAAIANNGDQLTTEVDQFRKSTVASLIAIPVPSK